MSGKAANINQGFSCLNCGEFVTFRAPGTKNRNHCPFCLYSQHLDLNIGGDRKSSCRAKMAPVGKYYKPDGEEVLVHKCLECGDIKYNRVAGDDSIENMAKLPVVERL